MSVYCGDDEPVAYYRETHRTARKRHDCCACDIPIQPGQKYWVIAACYDGGVHGWKRCERCQFIHVHLRTLLPDDEWPDERLNCGHEFSELHGRPPPGWLAALAFWQPGEPMPHVALCTDLYAMRYGVPNYEQRNVCAELHERWNEFWLPPIERRVQSCLRDLRQPYAAQNTEHTELCDPIPNEVKW